MRSPLDAEWDTGRAVLRRGWWFIALAALAVMAVAAFATSRLPADERATGRLIVAPASTAEAAFSPDSVRVLTQPGVIGTLTQIIESPGTLENSASDAGVGGTVLDDYSVSAQEVAGSMVVEVHVDGPDAATVEALTSGLIEASTQQFDELYPVYRVHVLDQVRHVEATTAPSVIQYSVLGGVLGALGAVLLLLTWDRLDQHLAVVSRRMRSSLNAPSRPDPDPDADPTEPDDTSPGSGTGDTSLTSTGERA